MDRMNVISRHLEGIPSQSSAACANPCVPASVASSETGSNSG